MRGHWDLRVRLCKRICAWAEQGLLPRTAPNTTGIGNLYVDQGWVHLHRRNFDQAERCASLGQDWLRNSIDLVFATELAGQVALSRKNYAGAIEVFKSLRRTSIEGTRIWLVFSYRLADAISSPATLRGVLHYWRTFDSAQRYRLPESKSRMCAREFFIVLPCTGDARGASATLLYSRARP